MTQLDKKALKPCQSTSNDLLDFAAASEARRLELLNWLEDRIGTSWDCSSCGYGNYHCHSKECENCGAEFPTPHLLAFKLHASISDDEERIAAARERILLAFPVLKPQQLQEERDKLAEALCKLTHAVANMRVPQNKEDAGLQIHLTLGPDFEFARDTLASLQQEGK